MSIYSPISYITRTFGRCSLVSVQRSQRYSDVAAAATPPPPSALKDNWKTDLDTKQVIFKNISHVTPKTFSKFFYTQFKLKFVEEEEGKGKKSKSGAELLRNIAANYDYWMTRNNQEHLLYYRLEMMLQRLDYMKSVGLDSQQKLRQIQKCPPLLLFTFSDCSYNGKLVYLRGLLDKPNDDFIHIFHPITNKITANRLTIKDRMKTVEDVLRIKQPAAIRELLNMPCFFLDPSKLHKLNHMLIHKYSMPFFYDVDKHTAPVLPPVCNLEGLQLSAHKHFNNATSNDVIASLPTYSVQQILDKSYPTTNGKGTPECLSTFLVRAELEEEKDRTGGQPLKGRRGFNVPKRQY